MSGFRSFSLLSAVVVRTTAAQFAKTLLNCKAVKTKSFWRALKRRVRG